jgi:hypothetical protein
MGSRVSIRSVGLLAGLLSSAALVPSSGPSPPDFGQPLAGLTAEQLERFEDGKEDFEEVETVEEVSGPSSTTSPARTATRSPPSAAAVRGSRLGSAGGSPTASGRGDG